MSRPTLLTPDRVRRITELVAAGNDQETAALAAGISKSTHFAWMARGRIEADRLAANPRLKVKASEAPFVEYLEAVQKARAEAEARLVLLVAKAAQEPKTWQAAAWLLERRDPQRWGRVTRTELTGKGGGPVKQETTTTLSDADLAALADRLSGVGPVLPVVNLEG